MNMTRDSLGRTARLVGKKAVTDYRIPLLTILLFIIMSSSMNKFSAP